MTQSEAEVLSTREFIETIATSIERIEIYPRLNVHLDRVLLVLLLRCVRTARGVCTFAEQGCGDEAFILSRTVLEICLTTFFISNTDSEARAKRYLEYFSKDRQHLVKLIDKYQPAAAGSFSPDHEWLLAMAPQFKSPHQWNEGGLGAIAREPAQWSDGEKPSATEYWYEVIYRYLSHECHCTSVAAHPDLIEINYSHTGCYSPFSFWESKSSELNGPKAVLNAFAFTAECVRHALHGLGRGVPEEIRNARKLTEEVFNQRVR